MPTLEEFVTWVYRVRNAAFERLHRENMPSYTLVSGTANAILNSAAHFIEAEGYSRDGAVSFLNRCREIAEGEKQK